MKLGPSRLHWGVLNYSSTLAFYEKLFRPPDSSYWQSFLPLIHSKARKKEGLSCRTIALLLSSPPITKRIISARHLLYFWGRTTVCYKGFLHDGYFMSWFINSVFIVEEGEKAKRKQHLFCAISLSLIESFCIYFLLVFFFGFFFAATREKEVSLCIRQCPIFMRTNPHSYDYFKPKENSGLKLSSLPLFWVRTIVAGFDES